MIAPLSGAKQDARALNIRARRIDRSEPQSPSTRSAAVRPTKHAHAGQRFTLIGHFGAGNIGNDCTLEAVMEALKHCAPHATLQCACAYPDEATRRFALPAYQLNRPAVSPRPGLLGRLAQEVATYGTALRAVRQTDILIFCGTNLLSDYLTGPKGWPYDVFKWTMLARCCGKKIVYFGVGVGPIVHRASRWLIGKSLAMANYRSYRDEASMLWATKTGAPTNEDAVSPEIVFGLALPAFAPDTHRTRAASVIGIGVKNYPEIESVERQRYRRYIATMASFIGSLLTDGQQVRLLVGDSCHDEPVVRDVLELVGKQYPGTPTIQAEVAGSAGELIKQISETDVVISPRFHNLVLGLMLSKPVIALSDHHKFDELMRRFDLSSYCLPLDRLHETDLRDALQRLQGDLPCFREHISEKIAALRLQLAKHYDAALRACGIERIEHGQPVMSPAAGSSLS